MEPERRLLIVDSSEGALQRLALDLLGRDFEVHYAADVDEAQLLAAETDGRINAVLFAADLALERVPDLAARFRIVPGALIPTGPRPAPRVVKALRHHGVRWHLWDSPADEAIRFVVSGVLHEHDPFELRYHLRVPLRQPARLSIGGRKHDTTIRDLGLGGACLVGGSVGEPEDRGELSFDFEDRVVTLPTRTAWSAPTASDALGVGGVAFLEVDHEAGEAIDALRQRVIARHRIEGPA